MSKRFAFAALTAAFLAAPALADETEGLVLAFDRIDRIVVMTDKTVWSLPDTIALPDDLAAGDRVLFDFTNGGDDEAIFVITEMTRLSKALPKGTDGGS